MKNVTIVLSAALVAMSALAANAQVNSSNSTMAPLAAGATKTESPGANAQVEGTTKQPDPSRSSSNSTMAPLPAGAKKTESPGAQVKGTTKQPDPSRSSSNSTMAPVAGGVAKTETTK